MTDAVKLDSSPSKVSDSSPEETRLQHQKKKTTTTQSYFMF